MYKRQVSVVCAYILPSAIRNGYNTLVHIQAQHNNENSTQTSPPTNQTVPPTENHNIPDDVFDRGYDTSEDISNRRFDIWKSAVEIFKTSPVFGISRANILPYVDDNLPDSYLVTNEYMRFDSMHNMFFEILVSQGAVGLITFLTFIIFVIVGIFKYGKYLWYHKYFPLFTVILSIAASACMSTLVMAEIVYVTSPISTIFWISISCLNHYISHEKAEKDIK